MVTPMTISADADVDVAIYGGGLCGVLAGHRCFMEGLTYRILEKEKDLGGVWQTLANNHSHLQVCSAKAGAEHLFAQDNDEP